MSWSHDPVVPVRVSNGARAYVCMSVSVSVGRVFCTKNVDGEGGIGRGARWHYLRQAIALCTASNNQASVYTLGMYTARHVCVCCVCSALIFCLFAAAPANELHRNRETEAIESRQSRPAEKSKP